MELGAIAGVATALSSARIEASLAAIGLATQIDVMQDIGQSAVHLIQAAALDPAVGQVLDLKA